MQTTTILQKDATFEALLNSNSNSEFFKILQANSPDLWSILIQPMDNNYPIQDSLKEHIPLLSYLCDFFDQLSNERYFRAKSGGRVKEIKLSFVFSEELLDAVVQLDKRCGYLQPAINAGLNQLLDNEMITSSMYWRHHCPCSWRHVSSWLEKRESELRDESDRQIDSAIRGFFR